MALNKNKEDLEDLEKKLQVLCKAKVKDGEAIQEVERKMTALLCPKGKKECEPVYCVFNDCNACAFLEKWRSLNLGAK